MKRFALVTGCSRGIGYQYCLELIKIGYNIIGVSRDTSNFTDLQSQFRDKELIGINADLSVVDNVYHVFDKVKDYNIDLVINNAGFGDTHILQKSDLANHLNMIDLNVAAVQILTHLFVEQFTKLNRGKILNISSIVGFFPMPYWQTYAATKAYVKSFSVAVNHELKANNSAVRVITICPGATESSFAQRARTTENNSELESLMTKIKLMPTKQLCSASLERALRKTNKDIIVIGWKNHLIIIASKIVPHRLMAYITAKLLKKIYGV